MPAEPEMSWDQVFAEEPALEVVERPQTAAQEMAAETAPPTAADAAATPAQAQTADELTTLREQLAARDREFDDYRKEYEPWKETLGHFKSEGITSIDDFRAYGEKQLEQKQLSDYRTDLSQRVHAYVDGLVESGELTGSEKVIQSYKESVFAREFATYTNNLQQQNSHRQALSSEIKSLLTKPENKFVPEAMVRQYVTTGLAVPKAMDMARAEIDRLRDAFITEHMTAQAAQKPTVPVPPANGGAPGAPAVHDHKNPMSWSQAWATLE